MCNFPASPSTPSADKCRVIPTANFRAKKPNWKSIHFESGTPINTSRRLNLAKQSLFHLFHQWRWTFRPKLQSRAKRGIAGTRLFYNEESCTQFFFTRTLIGAHQLHYHALFLSLRQESGFIFPVHTIDPPLIRMSKCGLPSPYQWHTDTANYAQPRFQPCSPIIPISLNAIKLSSVSTPQTMFSFLDSSLNCSTREATYLFCVDLFSGYLLFVGFM